MLSWQSHAWLYGGDFSKSFEECFTIREKAANNVTFTKGVYEQYCTDLLLPLDKTHQRIGNFSSDQMSYIQQLFRKMYTEAYKTQTNRIKRYAKASYDVPPGAGTRPEVRSFNGAIFRQYAEAVQRIKKVSLICFKPFSFFFFFRLLSFGNCVVCPFFFLRFLNTHLSLHTFLLRISSLVCYI